ncbi:MAG: succinate dehydrogenase [Pseudomonadota bacterium]
MRLWAVFGLLALTGCGAADNVARDQAKSVVQTVVTDRYPGVNPAPVTDCIIDAASAGEIIQLGSAAVTGITSSTVETVLKIGTRPEALTCLARNGVIDLGI